MLKGIVVVESPAKAKTLGNYLGNDYKVIASYGHIRDLVSKDGSVDPNNHFKMLWDYTGRGKQQIREISNSLKLSDNLFLATDPDREGEAISWHILETLNSKKALKTKNVRRVVFHEITKSAVQHAFENPKDLDQDLVDAYLARVALDYLVGFSISPILWRKMPGARSAGRVQSVALRLIVERELEIQRFEPEEYWTIHGDFEAKNGVFNANLAHYNGEKLDKLVIKNELQANNIKADLESKKYFIDKVEKKAVKRNPYAPFTTSSMQQDAIRKLGFSAQKTMQIAQRLYEGIAINGAMSGLITYMRTDSTNLSNEAISESRGYIEKNFGDKYLPKAPKIYKTKSKNAQEAHEAIRPTSFNRTPSVIKQYLSADEFALYELIWKRALASQMENAVIDQVSVNIKSKDDSATFRTGGSTIAFDGFLKVYVEATDDESDDKKSKKLPELKENEVLDLLNIINTQHFTQPPARFNEASLVKKLEELGIGRPSTYASIINVLQVRKYVTVNRRIFTPESRGFLVISFLKNFFDKYVEYEFTAALEEELDEISNGKRLWEKVLQNFWNEFNSYITQAQELTIQKVLETIEADLNDYIFSSLDGDKTCPTCETGTLHLRLGKYGAFLSCSNYPECKYIKPLGTDATATDMFQQVKIELGKDARYDNDTVYLKRGPYGYYAEWENTKEMKEAKPSRFKKKKTEETKKKKKPKMVEAPKRQSIPSYIAEPTELTLEDIIMLDSLPVVLGKHPKTRQNVELVRGRFGPYLKMGEKTYKLDKNATFLRLNKQEAVKIIDKANVKD
ncbi:MAG: type I DNA topoisomerase [Alphaproteobacteria bacterium]|nr:type I DNA topoisomerase [Alphaproteobacteria bacterium]